MTNIPSESSKPRDSDEPGTAADKGRTAAATREVNSGASGPQAHSSAPPGAHRQPAPGTLAPHPRSPWRSLGIGVLGLVGGVLLALIVQDILATDLLRDETLPIVLSLLVPALGTLGAVSAILIDNRNAKDRFP